MQGKGQARKNPGAEQRVPRTRETTTAAVSDAPKSRTRKRVESYVDGRCTTRAIYVEAGWNARMRRLISLDSHARLVIRCTQDGRQYREDTYDR